MTETQLTRTVQTQQVPGGSLQQEKVSTVRPGDAEMSAQAKIIQVIWFFAHLIAAILALRFVFLALGANMVGLVSFIYSISTFFVLPFRGIFPSPRTGEFYFDSAALLGIILYYLAAFLLVKVIGLFSKSE